MREFVRDPHCRDVLEAALSLAAQGIAVFPLKYQTKQPDTKNGFKNATTDKAKIRRWFGGGYKRNLGARTGQASGVWVFDADNLESLAVLEVQHGPLPLTRQSQSARGPHYWFRTTPLPIPSSTGRVAIGIDVKAEGGYVVVPPSIHPDGPAYRWINDAPIVEAPSWLLVLARKPPPPEPPPRPTSPRSSSRSPGGAYGSAALKGEIDTLAKTVNGSRNHQLNRASFCLHRLVAGGELHAGEVEQRLIEACIANGVIADDGMRSVMATIASGRRAGMLHPRSRNGGR